MKCPICKGLGKIERPRDVRNEVIQKKEMCKTLYQAGFSMRQIMKFTNYKSPRSVHLNILNHHKARKGNE